LSKKIPLIHHKITTLVSSLQKDALKAEVARNAGGSLVVKVGGMGASFIAQLVLARILGLENFGSYVYVWSWATILSLLGRLGFDVAAIRFVADYREKEQWGLLRGFLRCTNRVILASSLIAYLAVASIIEFLQASGFMDQSLAQLFWYGLLLLPAFAVLEVQNGILRGLNRVVLALTLQVIVPPLVIIMVIGLYNPVTSESVTALVALIVNLGALLIVILLQRLSILQNIPDEAKDIRPEFDFKTWYNATFSFFLGAGAQQLLRRLDVLIIGIFIGTSGVGVYEVAVRLIRLVQLGLQATNIASAHLFARLQDRERRSELQSVVFLTVKLTCLSTLPAILVLFFWAADILMLFGKEFVSGLPVLQILLLGELINVFTGPNALLMNMTGRHEEMVRILGITLLIDASLLLVMTLAWGLIGAAIATTFTIMIRNIITVVRVWHHLGVNSTIFSSQAWGLKGI